MDTQDGSQIERLFNWVVDQAIGGVTVAGQEVLASAESLAASFRDDPAYKTTSDAIDALIRWEVAKCGAVGFVTNLGGLLTLPVAIPADMAATWIVQARMAAAIAILRGYNVHDERVRTFILLTLIGDSVKEVLAQAGIKIGEKLAMQAIKQIPRAAIVAINKAVGFRIITKLGQKGLINLGKMVPLAGGLIGGALDAVTCAGVGLAAKTLFGGDEVESPVDSDPDTDHPPVGAVA